MSEKIEQTKREKIEQTMRERIKQNYEGEKRIFNCVVRHSPPPNVSSNKSKIIIETYLSY